MVLRWLALQHRVLVGVVVSVTHRSQHMNSTELQREAKKELVLIRECNLTKFSTLIVNE